MSEIGTDIQRAVRHLRDGQLVGIPTETVYGLAADAKNESAIEALFKAKGRPSSHPVIVHIANMSKLSEWAENVPPEALELGTKFWPGPLTMVLRKKEEISKKITGGQDTLAIRVPRHPITRKLLEDFGGGLVAPSANKFGRISPTRAQDVLNEFGDEISYVLEGGPCTVGIESTIVDLSCGGARVLRPGMISREEIEETLSLLMEPSIGISTPDSTDNDGTLIRAPGLLKSHYAPRTPLHLVSPERLNSTVMRLQSEGKRIAVMSFQAAPEIGVNRETVWLEVETDPISFARDLYMNMRRLDGYNCDIILAEETPEADEWLGIIDRLKRASTEMNEP